MKLGKNELLTLYTNLVRARAWDLLFASRLSQGKLIAFYHRAEGGEAPGVGACSFLNKDDLLWAHHRGHGVPHTLSKGVDPKYYLAEHCGKTVGCCGGVSSFHGSFPEYGVYGGAGTIGSCFPVSVGWGLGAKKNGNGQVVVCCFGDGTSNRGTLHEAFLMAANWKLPIVWVCENNGMSIYVPAEQHHPTDDIADLAKGYGMPAAVVDGQDVVAVAEAVAPAVARAREGKGPSFIECKTTRFWEHDIGTPDLRDHTPRSEEEIKELRQRDPVKIYRESLLSQDILTADDVERIDKETAEELQAAERFVDESPDATDDECLALNLYAE